MEKKCKVYRSEDISRFVDNELSPDQYNGIAQHLTLCQDCAQLAKEYKTLSAVFCDHAHGEVLKIDPARLKQKMIRTLEDSEENSEKKFKGNIFGLFGKNTYLKLASIAGILIFSLFTFQVGQQPRGPSAIVKSVDTDFASVMIFETQKEKHTIIWFSET